MIDKKKKFYGLPTHPHYIFSSHQEQKCQTGYSKASYRVLNKHWLSCVFFMTLHKGMKKIKELPFSFNQAHIIYLKVSRTGILRAHRTVNKKIDIEWLIWLSLFVVFSFVRDILIKDRRSINTPPTFVVYKQLKVVFCF